jgi:hypothetical protein
LFQILLYFTLNSVKRITALTVGLWTGAIIAVNGPVRVVHAVKIFVLRNANILCVVRVKFE